MTTTTSYAPPDWAFTFHGHRCPFMPIGYRMGVLAMERLGAERESVSDAPGYGFATRATLAVCQWSHTIQPSLKYLRGGPDDA